MKFKVEEDCFKELNVGDQINIDELGIVKVVERTERPDPYADGEGVFVVTVENPDFRDREDEWSDE